jgi:fibronectin type 3 domain-containing protein
MGYNAKLSELRQRRHKGFVIPDWSRPGVPLEDELSTMTVRSPMRRILVLVCLIGSAGACVNLKKPEKVAECAAINGCVNGSPVDSGGSHADGNTNPVDAQSSDPDATNPASDAVPSVDDTAPVNSKGDGGNLGNPIDGPVVTTDGPSDLPIVTTDAPSDPPASGGDVPPITDVVNNASDTRDGNKADVLAGACAVSGQLRPAGYPCRALAGLCDVEESCDGVSADCPADKLAAAGTTCRPAAGDCDIAETCTGSSAACPADGFKLAGTVCRVVAGPCDVAESCTGISATCPVDSVAPATTVCRASTDGNKCDPAENCTGSSASCPADLLYAPPAAPTSPSALAGTLQATIAWTAAVGATGYNVKRSTTTGRGYTTLGSSPTASASPYLDTGLTGSQTYYYVVSSIDTIATCESANSAQVSTTPTGVCVPPAVPVVTATANNGSVALTWPAVTGAVSYSVARSLTTGTGYSTIGTVTTGTGFTDANVLNGTTYYYVVTAGNGTCSSGNSLEASASPACTPPTAIADLSAQPGNGSVVLAWTAPTTAVSYQILRSTTSGSGYVLAGTKGAAGFTDTSVANGTTYYYVVTASNGACSSTNSNEASVTPACVPPAAPATVTPTAGDGQVSLTWTTSLGATMYRVSRNTTGTGTFPQIATPTAASYVDQPLTDGTNYYYVVAASNGSCWSADSAVASATPVCTPPPVPGTITATAGDAQVTLSWVASTPAPASYTLQRKTGANGTYATIASPTVASYTDSTPALTNGTTYYYKVSANNSSCSSAYDTEVPATPVAACSQGAPGSVAAALTPSTQVKITWTASSPVPTGGYDIGRSLTSGSGYTSVGHVGNAILTFTDSDLTLAVGTTYFYQVTAIGTCTAASPPASIALACQTPAAPNAGLTATNSAGSITVSWTAVTGATAYTLSRSTTAAGTYTTISSNQTAATFTDPATGLTNGTNYFYKVSASNANHQCVSALSSATPAVRSCTIPTVPAGLTARRSGNKQVTLVWTNSTGATTYNVLRSTTSGSGYTSVATVAGSPYKDITAVNTTAYFYVVTASSDAGGNCSSANSAQVAVPACTVWPSGTHSQQLNNNTAEWCVVSCADISSGSGFAQPFNCGSRTAYLNGVQATCGSNVTNPAKANGGYAFYFTAAADGGFVGAQMGNIVADATCAP